MIYEKKPSFHVGHAPLIFISHMIHWEATDKPLFHQGLKTFEIIKWIINLKFQDIAFFCLGKMSNFPNVIHNLLFYVWALAYEWHKYSYYPEII